MFRYFLKADMKSEIPDYPIYRTVPAEVTFGRIQPFLKEMGITRLANITGLDEIGIPVYVAVRPNSRSLSLSQGKGLSSINAKVSALMETIESYHGETIETEIITGSINSLSGSGLRLSNVDEIPSYRNSAFNHHVNAEWIEGNEIFSEERSLVPYEAVNVDLRIKEKDCPKYFIQSSNGLASGNTDQEAISHAICELIERDSYACWSLQSRKYRSYTKINIDTVQNPICCRLIERFYQANACIGIWDISSDIGIPAFLVRVISRDKPPLSQIRPASGFGCHPDKILALIRAITEAAQSRLTFIAGARDDIRLSHYRTFISEDEYSKWHHSIFEEPAFCNFSDLNSHQVHTPEDVWTTLKNSLIKANIHEAHAVNITKEQFQISVFKVVIPGLEGGESYRAMKYGPRALSVLQNQKPAEEARYA